MRKPTSSCPPQCRRSDYSGSDDEAESVEGEVARKPHRLRTQTKSRASLNRIVTARWPNSWQTRSLCVESEVNDIVNDIETKLLNDVQAIREIVAQQG